MILFLLTQYYVKLSISSNSHTTTIIALFRIITTQEQLF